MSKARPKPPKQDAPVEMPRATVHRAVIEGLSTEVLAALRTEISLELDRRRGKAVKERS